MKSTYILLDIKNHCAFLNLNRSSKLNAINMDFADELYKKLRLIATKDDVNCIIIRGKGKAFCSGGDLEEMHHSRNKKQYLKDLTSKIHQCILLMRSMKKPIIASVNGTAYGAGFALMLGCDIIIANKKSKFNTAFIRIGLAPGCGTQLIQQSIGYHKACEYILTAKEFTAVEAENIGLINKAVEKSALNKEIEQYIERFNNLSIEAIGKAKELINKSFETTLSEQFQLESIAASSSANSSEFIESIDTFIKNKKAKKTT